LDELCVSTILSFLDPLDALQVEQVDVFLRGMVGRGWPEKKIYAPILHLTMPRRFDITDKTYALSAWLTINEENKFDKRRGQLFCIGGEREDQDFENAIYLFGDNHSSQLGSLYYQEGDVRSSGFPRTVSAAAVTVDSFGRIRTFGGFNGEESTSDGYSFSPQERERAKWRRSGCAPHESCFASVCTTLDGDIVHTGGGSSLFQGSEVTPKAYIQRPTALSDDTTAWEEVASMQTVRCGHNSAVLRSGKVMVVGGYAGALDYLSSAEYYDAAVDKWIYLPPMHFPRSGFGFGLSPQGAVYAFGGSSDGSNGHDTVELFDERVGRWELLPQRMKANRGYMGGCFGGSGALYACGGVAHYVKRSSMEFMDPRTQEWAFMQCVGRSNYFSRYNFSMIYSMT